MHRPTHILLVVSSLLVLSAGAAGCTSRTLPLPPPTVEPLAAGPDENGLVTVEGLSQEGAAVGIINDATFEGVIVTTPESGCGRSCPFSAQVPAEPGDPLRIWQFFGTSEATEVFVPED